MIEIDVPGYRCLRLSHLVLDYNGTLAVDGELLPGVARVLNRLAVDLKVHVVTADTFGKVHKGMEGVSCEVSILPNDRLQIVAREDFRQPLVSWDSYLCCPGSCIYDSRPCTDR